MADQRDLLGMPEGEEARKLLEQGAADLPEETWAPTLVHLVQVTEAKLRREGIAREQAPALARGVVLELASYFGARRIYLPAGARLKTALRDIEIYRRARRGNIQALADEFELTDIQVYRIIRQQRALHLRKIQGRLFHEEQEGN